MTVLAIYVGGVTMRRQGTLEDDIRPWKIPQWRFGKDINNRGSELPRICLSALLGFLISS